MGGTMRVFIWIFIAGAAAFAGIYWLQPEPANDTSAANAQTVEAAPIAEAETGIEDPNPFQVFMGPATGDTGVEDLNGLCGFDENLTSGGVLFRPSSREGSLAIYQAEAGESLVLKRFEPETGPVLAFETFGELTLQTAHQDRAGFYGRVWTLDEAGEPTFSNPLLERARIPLECDDAAAAARWINENALKADVALDPVRSGVRAFEIGDGYVSWFNPAIEGVVEACTPADWIETLPSGERFLLKAEFDDDATFGDDIYHEMSGESLSGTEEPMALLTIAEIDEQAEMASLQSVRVPLSWHAILEDENGFAPVFRFDAIQPIYFVINPDGSRSHSMTDGGVESVSIPCRDPATAIRLLKELRASVEQ